MCQILGDNTAIWFSMFLEAWAGFSARVLSVTRTALDDPRDLVRRRRRHRRPRLSGPAQDPARAGRTCAACTPPPRLGLSPTEPRKQVRLVSVKAERQHHVTT